jgi:hypothetical protein
LNEKLTPFSWLTLAELNLVRTRAHQRGAKRRNELRAEALAMLDRLVAEHNARSL